MFSLGWTLVLLVKIPFSSRRPSCQATKDGYDVQMQTNHLSHFLLTKEPLGRLGDVKFVKFPAVKTGGGPMTPWYNMHNHRTWESEGLRVAMWSRSSLPQALSIAGERTERCAMSRVGVEHHLRMVGHRYEFDGTQCRSESKFWGLESSHFLGGFLKWYPMVPLVIIHGKKLRDIEPS